MGRHWRNCRYRSSISFLNMIKEKRIIKLVNIDLKWSEITKESLLGSLGIENIGEKNENDSYTIAL